LIKYFFAAACIGLMSASATAQQTDPSVKAAYVVIGPAGSQIARAVLASGVSCPSIQFDGVGVAMQLRAAPALPAFPVSVCELVIPARTAEVQIAGRRLPLFRAEQPRRIAALGDTGCRMKTGHAFQPCDDPDAWPFASVSRAVAEWRPELIINTGDYLYREMACTAGDPSCAASPVGDNWATWEKDFFVPAAPLLAAAPWVVGRGDHEMCSRGGSGFIRFLDPRPWTNTCQDFTDSYVIRLGDLSLVMMDTSAAASTSEEKIARYTNEFSKAKALQSGQTWLLTHMPIWAFRPSGKGDVQKLVEMTQSLDAASRSGLTGFSLVMSSHIHLFQVLSFADRRPLQLVVGTGGTALDQGVSRKLKGESISGTTVSSAASTAAFGYTTLERDKNQSDWRLTFRGLSNKPLIQCRAAGPELRCDGE